MRSLVCMLFFAMSAAASSTDSPPDLRLEWVGATTPLRGVPGQTLELKALLRNVGGRPVFATILRAYTSLGPFGSPIRLQPGPAAGASVPRTIHLPLATGMREFCMEATLQTVSADDPRDPNPQDNRICRVVRVDSKEDE